MGSNPTLSVHISRKYGEAPPSRHDNLRLILWDSSSGLVQDRGPLPDGFVGEGIAVIDPRDNWLDVLLVDDLRGRALRLWIDSWR